MTIPVWAICLGLTAVVWVPFLRHETHDWDIAGAFIAVLTVCAIATIWIAYIAYLIGRAVA